MGVFVERWHEAHHTGTTVDLINCPICQDEYIAWTMGQGRVTVPVDRLEDQEV